MLGHKQHNLVRCLDAICLECVRQFMGENEIVEDNFLWLFRVLEGLINRASTWFGIGTAQNTEFEYPLFCARLMITEILQETKNVTNVRS